jgi:hypothetical protein
MACRSISPPLKVWGISGSASRPRPPPRDAPEYGVFRVLTLRVLRDAHLGTYWSSGVQYE